MEKRALTGYWKSLAFKDRSRKSHSVDRERSQRAGGESGEFMRLARRVEGGEQWQILLWSRKGHRMRG